MGSLSTNIRVLGGNVGADVLIKELENKRNTVGKHQMLTHVFKLYPTRQPASLRY